MGRRWTELEDERLVELFRELEGSDVHLVVYERIARQLNAEFGRGRTVVSIPGRLTILREI